MIDREFENWIVENEPLSDYREYLLMHKAFDAGKESSKKAIKDAINEINSTFKWHYYENGDLPDNTETYYYCYYSKGLPKILRYGGREKGYWYSDDNCLNMNPVAWCELPILPKVE